MNYPKVKYTSPSREDGFWGADCSEDGLEIVNRRDNGSYRPICKIENPDFADNGDCAGNFALMCASPAMYECLIETEKLLRFMMIRASTTEAEKAEYRSVLAQIEHIFFTVNKYSEDLKIEANVSEDE